MKYIKSRLLLLFFLSLFPYIIHAATYPLNLGIAGQFNGFILGDMNASQSDIEGRLAVGGDLTLNDYAIGLQLDNSWNNRDTLVVGGKINYNKGRIYHGNARSGGAENIAHVGFYTNDPSISSGQYISGNPLNFKNIEKNLKDKSTAWGDLTTTGIVSNNSYGNLELHGLLNGLNVFDLTASDLQSASSFWLDIPEKASALINIMGSSITLNNFGFFRTVNGKRQQIADNKPSSADEPNGFRYNPNLSQTVLLNLVNATQLTMDAIGIKASILAPLAATTFYNGQVNGNLIVASLQGKIGEKSGQINNIPFVTVSEPSVFILIFFTLPYLIYRRRKYATFKL